MLKRIDGLCFVDLINSGIKNLDRYRSILNDLNVFPVPDGDTGTNMVMTLRYGYEAIKNTNGSLSEISRIFSTAAVFGARGNSGVIVSQFFKGVSEAFDGLDAADSEALSNALENGCKSAYAAVATPVEGTMLTVLKDASLAVSKSLPLSSIEDVIDVFLDEASLSLQNTPNLLPILKKASVVDSGGSGIVYFFEGVKKHLYGETVDHVDDHHEEKYVDFSKINKDTSFDFGYCTEGLIQLKIDTCDFDHSVFTHHLTEIGESVVSSLEGDKVKIHVHTKDLGQLMSFCQSFGEFLTVKIENMTVQNLEKEQNEHETKKFLYSDSRGSGSFGIVAVATNAYMQQKFFDMGADVVILSELAPSSRDFLDAFELIDTEDIIVFPNSSNSILAAEQAGEMYSECKIHVAKTSSAAECYASLSIIDFDSDVENAICQINETVSSIYQVSLYRAASDKKYGSKTICENDYFALSGKKILEVGEDLDSVMTSAVVKALEKNEHFVVTLFYGKSISTEKAEELCDKISELGYDVEVCSVSTLEASYEFIMNFE